MSRILFLSVGWISAVLGTIGAFVPLLPTVPLYLLAALCFARCSERLHAWFTSTNLYQKNLKSYAEGKGMTRKTKLRIMLTISIQLAIGYMFMRHTAIGRIALVSVWCGLMVYFAFIVPTQAA